MVLTLGQMLGKYPGLVGTGRGQQLKRAAVEIGGSILAKDSEQQAPRFRRDASLITAHLRARRSYVRGSSILEPDAGTARWGARVIGIRTDDHDRWCVRIWSWAVGAHVQIASRAALEDWLAFTKS